MHFPKIPRWQRIIQSLATTEVISSGFLTKYLHRMDTAVLNLSQGRKSLTTMLTGLPVVVLSTIGARTGKTRTLPLAGIPDEDKIILIATSYGSPSHPAWYYNLLANPEIELRQNNHKGKYIARIAEPKERQDYWQLAVHYYPGYLSYEKRCNGREIPIFVLEPAG